jgi:hypothetical protein
MAYQGPAWGAIDPLSWDNLSDKDISPEGRAALSMDPGKWKHAETEHFVYHYTNEKEAETIYINSEVYYRWVKEIFGITKDKWTKKNHVFIFSDNEKWSDFKSRTGNPGEFLAFTTGWELYIYRDPHWVKPRISLAHEITHIILFRFLDGPIPLFLNEGFAEFVSYRAIAMQMEKNEFDLRTVRLMKEKDFIPIEELADMSTYPTDKIGSFYRESELLTRYLILNNDSKKYYELLRSTSNGRPFSKAAYDIYSVDMRTLEKKFRSFATTGK